MAKCRYCEGEFTPTAYQIARYSWVCRPCRRAHEKDWRARRKEQGDPVVTKNMPREYHREYERDYRSKPENRRRQADNQARYRNDPNTRPRHEARWAVNRAIASGRLARQPCQVCGAAKADAHHHDYSKPLDVTWLCRPCHAAEHRRAKAEQVRG